MKVEKWYYIDSGAGRGSWNMAVDVVLAKTTKDIPFLRFYKWKPYCLSLGYGQRFDEFNPDRCREESIESVRRPTGGRAILHSDEVTYSIALSDRNPLFKLSIIEFYRYISAGLAAGLQRLGVPVIIEKSGIQRKAGKGIPAPLCFSSVGRYELKINGKKIVGSAQRRYPTCLLQHGSVLLGEHHLLQETLLKEEYRIKGHRLKRVTSSVGSELGRHVSYKEAVKSFEIGFQEGLNIILEPYILTDAQVNMAKSLEKEYALLILESKAASLSES